jgi:hypothetical protein
MASEPAEPTTRQECGVPSPTGRRRCLAPAGHDGEHMSGVTHTMWSTPGPADAPEMPRQADPKPMPFDLWWSPSMARFLTRHEDMDDEHLVWVVQSGHESLRHYLGTGLESNPPLPDDAVQLVLADPAQTTELDQLRRRNKRLAALSEEVFEQKDSIDRLVAERDALSLLLRGVARKLAGTRAELKQEWRDGAWVLERIRRSLGTPDDRAVSSHAAEVRAARDLALWLHAEAAWQRDEAAADADKFRDYLRMANKLVDRRGAERNERQARIDAALDLLDQTTVEAPRADTAELRVVLTGARAALVGGQPKAEGSQARVWVHGADDNPPRISPREAAETGIGLRNNTGHVWHHQDGAWQLDGKRAAQHGRDTRWGFWALLEHCGRLTEVPPPLSVLALRDVEEADADG